MRETQRLVGISRPQENAQKIFQPLSVVNHFLEFDFRTSEYWDCLSNLTEFPLAVAIRPRTILSVQGNSQQPKPFADIEPELNCPSPDGRFQIHHGRMFYHFPKSLGQPLSNA